MTLANRIEEIISAAGIDAGVAVWHIESDTRLDVNGDEPYPMASTFKIPILATACRQLTAGAISLDSRVPLADEDKSLGSGILPYFESGLAPTLRDLLTLMIIISDNTATDIVVDYLGGAAVIEGYMRELGLTEIFFKKWRRRWARSDGLFTTNLLASVEAAALKRNLEKLPIRN